MNNDSLAVAAKGALPLTPTRDRLVAAAAAAVAEGGYQGASVKVVSTRAGVAAGALYRHFPSKAALFAEVFRDISERELAASRAAAAACVDPVDALVAAVRTFARRALRVPRLAWALLGEPVDPLVEAERLTYRRRHVAALADLVAEGVGAGRLPPQDAAVTAAALVGAAAEVLVGPLASGDREPDTLIDELTALARRTVGADTTTNGHAAHDERSAP